MFEDPNINYQVHYSELCAEHRMPLEVPFIPGRRMTPLLSEEVLVWAEGSFLDWKAFSDNVPSFTNKLGYNPLNNKEKNCGLADWRMLILIYTQICYLEIIWKKLSLVSCLFVQLILCYSCIFEPEGNACSLTDSTAEEHVLALVEHAADEARDRINQCLPNSKVWPLNPGSLFPFLFCSVFS